MLDNMKAIRVQGRVVIEMDEVMDVEDDLKGPELCKACGRLLRELAKDYVYDAPVKIDSICLEGEDKEYGWEEIED
jgi:hypothetical protein